MVQIAWRSVSVFHEHAFSVYRVPLRHVLCISMAFLAASQQNASGTGGSLEHIGRTCGAARSSQHLHTITESVASD
jgi:hypothetical protein